jgi:N6-adenosine-specific RNA methylase IME4
VGKFSVILADPPWKYSDKKANDPKLGGVTYPVLSLEEIKALKVADIAAKDSVLFLWTTMPMLQEGLDVIKAKVHRTSWRICCNK